MDAEGRERLVLFGTLAAQHRRPTARDPFGNGEVGEVAALGGEQRRRCLHEIRAMIAAFGNRGWSPRGLLDSRPQRFCEAADLDPGIVDVELPSHRVAGPLEQGRDPISLRRATTVPHVQRAGGIRGDELDIHSLPCRHTGTPVSGPLCEHPRVRGGKGIGSETEIDEAGPGNTALPDDCRGERKGGQNALGHRARIAPLPFGQLHCEIGGEVAVARVARPLEGELKTGAAQRRGDASQLAPQHFAHAGSADPEAFFFGIGATAAGAASGFTAGVSGFGAASLSLRAPFPSFP